LKLNSSLNSLSQLLSVPVTPSAISTRQWFNRYSSTTLSTPVVVADVWLRAVLRESLKIRLAWLTFRTHDIQRHCGASAWGVDRGMKTVVEWQCGDQP